MKVHGEGLADGIKLTTSDTEDDEVEDDEEDQDDGDEIDDGQQLGDAGKASESELDRFGIGANNGGRSGKLNRSKKMMKRASSLNNSNLEEEEEEEELMEEIGANEESDGAVRKLTEIKREYSPEQTGDGKRPYRRNRDKLNGGRRSKRKLLVQDNEQGQLDIGFPPMKRGRKPKILQQLEKGQQEQQQQQQLLLLNNHNHQRVEQQQHQQQQQQPHHHQQNNIVDSVDGNTPTYYTLSGYARQYSSNVVNYTPPSGIGSQLSNPMGSAYHGRSLYASQQLSNNQESSNNSVASSTISSAVAPTTGSSNMNGNQQQHHGNQQTQLSSPNNTEQQTNGTPPLATLSEW